MGIQFMSAVLFVKDMASSRHFYEDLLEQPVDLDLGLNVGYKGGLAIMQTALVHQVIFGSATEVPTESKTHEVYFETKDLDTLIKKLEGEGVRFIHPVREQPWGQRVFRVYDPDGHIVDVGEPMPVVIFRMLGDGKTAEEISAKTSMPLEIVQAIIQAGEGQ